MEGKRAIEAYFAERSDTSQSLVWAPGKIEVAASGELAYSLGDFRFTQKDSSGIEQTFEGNSAPSGKSILTEAGSL